MLNELYKLYQGLEAAGEIPPTRHSDIQSPGMGTTFRVLLNKSGQAERIEWLQREKIKDTWSLGNSNRNQFPAIKLIYPLLPDQHQAYKDWKQAHKSPDATTYREAIKQFAEQGTLSFCGQSVWPDYRNKIVDRQAQLASLQDSEAHCVYELFERYLASETGLDILEGVARLLIERANEATQPDEFEAICETLFAKTLENGGKTVDSKRVTLLLDYRPFSDLNICATSRDWVQSISQVLFATDAGMKKERSPCALTGDEEVLVSKKFPNEKLAVVGKTFLFAKNASTSGPTVQRYGKSGTDAYHVGETLVQNLAAGLSLLTTEQRKGITWSTVSPTVGTSPSLLLSYCLDDTRVGVMPLLTGVTELEDFEDYEEAAGTVLRLLEGKNIKPDSRVEIAELVVIDKANRKINFSELTTISALETAAHTWVAACNNTPPFKMEVVIRKAKKECAHWSIAPRAVVDISKTKFIRDGSESRTVPAISFADSMRLFLSNAAPTKRLAGRLLSRVADQYQPLIRINVQSRLQSRLGAKALVKTSVQGNNRLLNAVTLMAVLLHKIEREKETYMNDLAFRLGQFCAAMDEMHIGFCKTERGGQIPNILIGNQTYGFALQDPLKALDFVAMRIKPYQAWIRRVAQKSDEVKKDKAVKAGIYAYYWLTRNTAALRLQLETAVAKDKYYKPELMLGYFAGRPFEKSKEAEAITENKEENKG